MFQSALSSNNRIKKNARSVYVGLARCFDELRKSKEAKKYCEMDISCGYPRGNY